MLHLIWMLIIGLIAGAIAKAIMPGRDPGGLLVTMILGIAGSFVGGLLANMLGLGDGNRTVGLIGSIIGALILLFLYRMFAGRRRTV